MINIAEVFILGLCIANVFGTTSESSILKNCDNHYAKAVYNELMRAIEIINANASSLDHDNFRSRDQPGTASTINDPASLRKFQEDEDYGGGGDGQGLIGGLEIPSIVPMIFKIVGSALSLNSSGVHENSQGIISMGISNRLTSLLGTLATSILGPAKPTPRPPPPRRRRRSTTTTPASTTATEMETKEAPISTLSPSSPVPEATTLLVDVESGEANSIELQETSPLSFAGTVNETTFLYEAEVVNVTEAVQQEEETRTVPSTTITIAAAEAATTSNAATIPAPTTTKVLYKESNLGEFPVYAPAFDPFKTSTSYPIYASSFLHALHAAPTTTSTSTAAPSTSTDPNAYNVPGLPFDYEVDKDKIIINTTSSSTAVPTKEEAITFDPNIATTPNIDYEEYEYEERTELAEALAAARSEADIIEKRLSGKEDTTVRSDISRSNTEAEDDEYLDSDLSKNRSSLSSLGRISRSIKL